MMYRYEDYLESTGIDDFGESSGTRVRVRLSEYPVVSHTPKGKQIRVGWKNRFVLNGGRKRYAHETKDDALVGFLARKRNQADIIQRQLKNVIEARRLGEKLLEK